MKLNCVASVTVAPLRTNAIPADTRRTVPTVPANWLRVAIAKFVVKCTADCAGYSKHRRYSL